jgi:Flp pilus assembly protein TadG
MMRRWKRLIRWLRRDDGQVLIIAALFMVVLLGFAALVIDTGRAMVERRRLQNAVDAAAHAAIMVLPGDPSAAQSAAHSWAAKNGMSGALTSVSITQTSIANDTVTVNGSRTVNYGFAKVLGMNSATITATARARTHSVTGASGLMPFGIVDLNGSSPGFGYTFNQQVILREAPGDHMGPGNYGFLRLDGPGANELRQTIAQGGSSTSYAIGSQIQTQPGQVSGPAMQGLNAWAASNGDSMYSSCSNWNASHSTNDGVVSIVPQCRYRVVLIPIINSWCNGSCYVTVLGFAQLYITGWVGEGPGNNDLRLEGVFLNGVFSHQHVTIGPANTYGTRLIRLTQ